MPCWISPCHVNINSLNLTIRVQGPVVQSMVSLKSLLRGQLLFYDFITKYTDSFCKSTEKLLSVFQQKNIGILQRVAFEILMKC